MLINGEFVDSQTDSWIPVTDPVSIDVFIAVSINAFSGKGLLYYRLQLHTDHITRNIVVQGCHPYPLNHLLAKG